MTKIQLPTINIKRDSGYTDRLRGYKVELDSVIVGEVADEQDASFDIKPGTHTLRLRVDWAKSNTVNFESKPSQTINFRCASRMKGLKALFVIVYALLMPNKYIELEQIN